MRVLFWDRHLPAADERRLGRDGRLGRGTRASRLDLRRGRAPISGGTPGGWEPGDSARRSARVRESADAVRSRGSAGSPARRRHRRADRRLPSRPGALRDGIGIGRAGKAAAAKRGIPVVSSYHTDFARYADAYGAGWLKRAVRGYIARFHRSSRRVYTPSSVARELSCRALE